MFTWAAILRLLSTVTCLDALLGKKISTFVRQQMRTLIRCTTIIEYITLRQGM